MHKSDSLDHLLGILRRSGPAASSPPTTEGGGAPGRRPFGSPLADAFKEPESELRRLIVDTMSEALVAVDHEGRMIDANPAALRILGRPEAEVLGRPVARHVALPFDADGNQLAPDDTPTGSRPARREWRCATSSWASKRPIAVCAGCW